MVETIPPTSLGLTFRVVPVVDDGVRSRNADGIDNGRPNDAINPAIDNDNPNGNGDDERIKDSSPSKRLPVVSVHLERLVGYQPETDEEIDSIRSQLVCAMWTRYHQGHQQDHLPKEEDVNVDTEDNGDSGEGGDKTHHLQDTTSSMEVEETTSNTNNSNSMLMIPPPDFDEQIQELLDAKVARFGIPNPLRYRLQQSSPSSKSDQTRQSLDGAITNSKTSSAYFILPYPPKLLRPTKADSSSDDGPTPTPTTTIIPSDESNSPPTDWLQTEQVWAEIECLEFTLGRDRSQISTKQKPDETSYDTFNEYDEQEDDGNNRNGDHKDDVDDVDYNQEYNYNDDYNDEEYETPCDVEFLTRLAKHLRDTSRPLLWKHAMAKELQQCVEEELARLDHNDWIQSKRQAKLDHLYTVRETLVHQAQLAQDRYSELDKIREDQVQQEIVQSTRRNKGYNRHGWSSVGSTTRDDGNKEYLDGFGNSELSFPEEFQLLGMMPDKLLQDVAEDEEEDDWGIGDESDDDSSTTTSKSCYSGEVSATDDAHGIDTDGVCNGEPHEKMPSTTNDDMALGVSNTQEDIKLHPEGQVATEDLDGFDMNQSSLKEDCNPLEGQAIQSPFLRRKEQRRKAKLRKQQERIESRKLMEDELRSKYTTKDLILAQTLLQAMEKKVQSVEELLESLQDEVWAAEEEEEEGEEEQDWEHHDDATSENKLATPNNKNSSMSLLDQVLAMILGALPIDPGCDVKEHFEYIRQEHAFIVEGWEAYFGRLPPASNIGTR